MKFKIKLDLLNLEYDKFDFSKVRIKRKIGRGH